MCVCVFFQVGDFDDLSNSFLTYFVLPVAFWIYVWSWRARERAFSFICRLFILVFICDIVCWFIFVSTTRWFVLCLKIWSAVRYLFFSRLCISYLDCIVHYTWVSTIFFFHKFSGRIEKKNLHLVSLWFRVWSFDSS